MDTRLTRVSGSRTQAIGVWIPLAIVTLLLAVPQGWAIVINEQTSAAINTAAPGDDRGWKYVGKWATSSAVAIGPNYFLTAQHIGLQMTSTTFTQNGGSLHTVTGHTLGVDYFDLPSSDLRVWRVAESFTNYAPLWSGGSEVGHTASLIGRGRVRDSVLNYGSGDQGWDWLETAARPMSWGMNVIEGTEDVGAFKEIYFDFDEEGVGDVGDTNGDLVSDEGHYTRGDSGGGVFIFNSTENEWQLAGISYAVTSHYYNSGGWQPIPDGAAVYDGTGLLRVDPNSNNLIGGKSLGYAHKLSDASYAAELAPYVPEPATMCLLAIGGLGLLARRRRR